MKNWERFIENVGDTFLCFSKKTWFRRDFWEPLEDALITTNLMETIDPADMDFH
jgi:hypothetical protein